MDRTEEYLSVLGVAPGANAEEVKRAFRARIKQYHPDTAAGGAEVNETALKLIEAYQALKEGAPPRRFKDTPQGQDYLRRQRAEAYRRRAAMARERHHADISRFARAAGRRLYEQMFGRAEREEQAPDRVESAEFWERLSEMVFGVEPETRFYGENIEVHEYVPRPRTSPSGRTARPATRQRRPARPVRRESDPGQRYFDRAENLLRQVVYRYDVPGSLRRRSWLREYLAGLNNCQILFRDVAVRHPAFSVDAMNRVRQIHELANELRQMG